MLGCCSRHFYCCLCIGSSSRLLEETLQVLSAECPGSQGENTFGFSVWDGEPLFNLPVYRACRYRRRSRPSFRTRPIVNPVYKSKPCRQTCLRTDGASAYVPAAILHIAEHGVMDPYQGLIYFLSYPCACWKHDTPLMHPCQARALFCRVCLMELEHMGRVRAYPRPAIKPSGVSSRMCRSSGYAACRFAPAGKVHGQSSREYHPDPNALLLTSSAACVRSSNEASPLSLSRLQATVGSACGISHLFFARRPIGALSKRGFCPESSAVW